MRKTYMLFLVLLLASCQSGKDQKNVEKEPKAATGDDLELSRAAFSGEIERVKVLLESGADVNSWSNLGSGLHTPLMYAVYIGDYEIAKVLIEAGADVNTAHSTDHSVLYHALESYKLRAELIQLLVHAGVNLNHTPLIWAVQFSQRTAGEKSEVPKIMGMLIDAGADVNERDRLGSTVLIYAVKLRKNEFVDILLRSGAEINATEESSGSTALACAVAIKAINTVRQLIEAGADLEMTDRSGNTPLMTAKSNGSEEIVKLLLDAGATR